MRARPSAALPKGRCGGDRTTVRPVTVAVLLLLAVADAAGGAWLLRQGLRRARRDAPAVIVVGVLLLVCAV